MIKPASAWAGEFQGTMGAAVARLRDDGVEEVAEDGDKRPRAVTITITDAMGGSLPPMTSIEALLTWSKGDHRAFVHVSRAAAVALRDALNEWFRPHEPR